MALDFKAAHAKLARDVPGFCKKYLPGGAVTVVSYDHAAAVWLARKT